MQNGSTMTNEGQNQKARAKRKAMKDYMKYIWKKYPAISVFLILLNVSCLSIGIYGSFFKLEALFIVLVLVFATWGIAFTILHDSFNNNKDAGIIVVLSLVINFYSAIWYYLRQKKLKPLNLSLSQSDRIKTELEMHDTEISQIIYDKGQDYITLELRPAIVHKMLNNTKKKNHTVWIQNIDLRLLKIDGDPDLPLCPQEISDGFLEIDGSRYENMLTMPFKEAGKCRLWLQFKNGNTLEIHCKNIETRSKSEAEYLEDFPDK